ISQPMASETIIVLTPNGINFPQTGKPKPTKQRQDSLEKRLKAEVKVFGAQSTVAANILSFLCALLGFVLLSVNLAALDPAFWNWNSVCDADLHGAGVVPGLARCRGLVETGSLR
uniref:Uncharacterized protein n=2 Tax=Canis lupus familiaris TaxID=9615 RepID=A0A8P0SW13_CANLF